MALSNIKIVGIGGGLSMVVGDLVHSESGTKESIDVAAGKVYGAQVLKNTSDGTLDVTGNVPVSNSVSGAIMTLTLQGTSEITDGTFNILIGN